MSVIDTRPAGAAAQPPPGPARPFPFPAALPALVVLIAAHSLAVGVCLLFFTDWAVAFGGWGAATPRFFARQAGIFHFVVVAAYLVEYFKYRGVTVLLTAKATAVVFLAACTLVDGGPWALPVSALGDALMGLAVWWTSRAR